MIHNLYQWLSFARYKIYFTLPNYYPSSQFVAIYSIFIYIHIVYKGFIKLKHTMPKLSTENVYNEKFVSADSGIRTLSIQSIMSWSQTCYCYATAADDEPDGIYVYKT